MTVPDSEAPPPTPTTADSLVRAVARVDSRPPAVAEQVIGENYELLDRIGGGGMGIVFRARDRRLGRDVAIKLLRATDAGGGGDSHLRRLFEREARATAQLLHPNIVTLHHVGEHDGTPYLVLELLSGETLAGRLARKGRLPVDEALEILDGVLAALAFAHERGVLHRDLKPTNVFITGDERVKVLDFGVAVTLDTDPGPVTRAAGTPGYMAPEHRTGAAQDTRTDVWAAAVLLVECLTGRRPDLLETVDGRGGTSPRRTTQLDAVPALPRDVDAILERALSAEPERRPASAAELRAELARATSPTVLARWRPRWWHAAAALACVVGLGAASAATGWWLRGERDAAPPSHQALSEINGLWDGGFGTLLLRVERDGSVRGVYEHDRGVVVGRLQDDDIHAWWCEEPTRRPPQDAGEVVMRVVREPRGLRLDGRWRYGAAPTAAWHEDWDANSINAAIDPELEQTLQRRLQGAACPRD